MNGNELLRYNIRYAKYLHIPQLIVYDIFTYMKLEMDKNSKLIIDNVSSSLRIYCKISSYFFKPKCWRIKKMQLYKYCVTNKYDISII